MADKTKEELIELLKTKEELIELLKTEIERQARNIMGKNFLGIPEVVEHFSELTSEQLEALAVIPFDEETLKACADTHILVADVGFSFLDVRNKVRKDLFYPQDWYEEGQEFAQRIETARWRLIRKTPVENSTSKTWKEQQALINSEIDEIPSARQVVYTTILHYLATGERLFKIYVRTCDVASSNAHVGVGVFYFDGFAVLGWDRGRVSCLGVASARQPAGRRGSDS